MYDNPNERVEVAEEINDTRCMPDIESGVQEGRHRTISYFSMFSGIGGFEKGIEDAFNLRPIQSSLSERPTDLHDASDELVKWKCVGFSEIDKNAINIYKHHLPGHHNYGSATEIVATDIPDFDLLVGGFPCQAFSIAGKRLGFDDTRGTLFFEIARILREKRPANFLLENVKGLLSHDNGQTFTTIITTLAEMGYCVEWEVLNSKNFGVPQNRERVFIHGFTEGCGRQIFPLGRTNEKDTNELKELTKGCSQCYRIYSIDGIANCQASQAGGIGAKTGLYEVEDYRIRRLTPIECERLQGFPDDWTKYGTDGNVMSDSARYKACGNAVTTNVIREIIERMYE